MTAINAIVAGKTVNRGINDKSIPDYTPAKTTRPLHLPVISMITPKGDLADDVGTVFIDSSDFLPKFGSVFDPTSPYYNPGSVLIKNLIAGTQAQIGIRRLSANKKVARIALSAFVQQVTITGYERDLAGQFKRDTQGAKIPNGKTYQGLSVEIKADPMAAGKEPGELERRVIPAIPAAGGNPAVPETQVFPLFEAIAGVGDAYNASGMNFGVRGGQMNYAAIAEFVKNTGVFPYTLKVFTATATGGRSYTKTADRRELVDAALFDTRYRGVPISLKSAFGDFTGTNVNRKVTPRPSPLKSVITYDEAIKALCQAMYAVEHPNNTSLVEVAGAMPYRQMNPFTCTNHTGAPYEAIVTGQSTPWDLSGAVMATGGISPFLDDTGSLPAYATEVALDDPFNLLASVKQPLTPKQAWEITNELIAIDLNEYVAGNETKNYTRNRQSFFWDVGYTQAVKDAAGLVLASRKDIMVIPDATVWEPGSSNKQTEIYSRFTGLVAAMRMYPESEVWGTATCRASINMIEARVNDEPTGDTFSMNLDLAYAYALFAGNAQGILKPAFAPDSGKNRVLRTMHTPNIEFEEDFIASENFKGGGITLRTLDTEQLYRPALVTVYINEDSVLKDQVTTFLCVCIEKICQDEWNNLSGDTSKTAADYVALFKDAAERKCRDLLGGMVKRILVEASYNEGAPGSRAVMNSIVHASFNKGKYMMNLDLFAYNEQDDTSGGTGVNASSDGGANISPN